MSLPKITKAKTKEIIIFLITYSLVGGVFGFGTNYLVFNYMISRDIPVTVAITTAFMIGGQASFFAHDNITFGRVELELEHWWQRWWRMMTGQWGGLAVNVAISNVLLLIDKLTSASISTQTIYFTATFSGAVVTICAAKFISHKSGSSNDSPDEPRKES